MEIKWISESTPTMKKVICAVFPMLWDRNIKSSIYSIGHDQSIIKDFNMAVYGSYIFFLINKGLIYDTENPEKISPYDTLVNLSEEGANAAKTLSGDLRVDRDAQVNAICSEIETADDDETWYGIDICLFAEDFEQLCNRNNEPILLSMLLYNKLLSQKKNVFLYSTYDIPNEIADAWTEMYTTAFDQKNIPIIFNRKGAAIHTKQSLLNLISNNGGLA